MPCLFIFIPKDYGTIQSDKEKDKRDMTIKILYNM